MKTKFIHLLITCVLGTGILSSCLKDDLSPNSPNIPQAAFTMINLYSIAPYVIHKADNNFIQTMNRPLQFKEINFVYLYPGNRKIQTIDHNNEVLIDSTFTIKDSTLYTSFVFDKPNNKAGQILTTDKLLNNLETNAGVRFLNLSKDEIAVDAYIGDVKIADNRAYDGANTAQNLTNYLFVSQQSGDRKITIRNSSDEILVEKDFNFKAKMHYTLTLVKRSTANEYDLWIYTQY